MYRDKCARRYTGLTYSSNGIEADIIQFWNDESGI